MIAVFVAVALLASACGPSTPATVSDPSAPVHVPAAAWVSADDPSDDVRLAARPGTRAPVAAIDVAEVAMRRSVDALHIRFTHVSPEDSPDPISDGLGVSHSGMAYSGLSYAIRLWGPEDAHRYLVIGVHPDHATSLESHGPFVCEYETCDMEDDGGSGLVTASGTSLDIEVPWERLEGLRGAPMTWIAWTEWTSEIQPDTFPNIARDWVPDSVAPERWRAGNANMGSGPGCCLSVAPEYRLSFPLESTPLEPPVGS